MDTALIKTFLTVVAAGSFIRASERLHITQTAVTARVRSLEQELSCKLFIRNRAGAKLTTEGELFLPHAQALMTSWQHAKHSIALPQGRQSRLRLGSETSLWNPLLVSWLTWAKTQMPATAIDTEINNSEYLLSALERSQLDAIIVHSPNYHAGFQVELLLQEKLVRVQSTISYEPNLYIDWGEAFERQHSSAISNRSQCPYHFDLGPAALQFMLKVGGNGWFRTRVVEPYLANGKLQRVAGAPEFTYPVYLSYRSNADNPELTQALQGVRELAALDAPWLL
jgi:DNA-binding transcriptional LysR family regulator